LVLFGLLLLTVATVYSIDITLDAAGTLYPFNATTLTGTFVINNGANCGGQVCANCNGSKYDVAFADAAANVQFEVDFGWTQASVNGPNCSAGSTITATKTVPTVTTPPTGYLFADPGYSWTVTFTVPGATTPVPCVANTTDPNENNTVVSPLSCYKYEWPWALKFPTMTYAQAQAQLRWGRNVGGTWVVNSATVVGSLTYEPGENKVVVSVPSYAEYAVFVTNAATTATSSTTSSSTTTSTTSTTTTSTTSATSATKTSTSGAESLILGVLLLVLSLLV